MLLWASSYIDRLLIGSERRGTIEELLTLQKGDGGWALATLGTNWKRSDDKDQDYDSSDGYGTGFVVYVLRRAGVPAGDTRIQKALRWLKANQRASGRWFTRSAHKDSN